MTTSEMAALMRLARRTARRNLRRTTLVVALIAVPVASAQIAAGMIAAAEVTPDDYATQALGAADANVAAYGSTPEVRDWVARHIEAVAPDATVVPYRTVYSAIPGVAGNIEATDLDPTAPIASGKLGLVAGRVPQQSGEIMLSEALMTLGELSIGDATELTTADGAVGLGSHTVVGIVRDVLYKDRAAAVVSSTDMDAAFAADGARLYREAHWLIAGVDEWVVRGALDEAWAVKRASFLPEAVVTPVPDALSALPVELYRNLSADQIDYLVGFAAAHGPGDVEAEAWGLVPDIEVPSVYVAVRSEYTNWQTGVDEVLQAPPVVGTVAAALLLAEVALVAGAAYATGARRRLRELGLMTVNGATDQHLRWSVVGEGLLAGLLGAAIGTAIAIVALIAGQPIMQLFVDRLILGMPIGPLDLVGPAVVGVIAATLAAWVPARAASAVPATIALQGRMPLRQPRRWVVPVGLGIAAFGAFLLVVAKTAIGDSGVYQAGLGVVLMIAGFAILAGPLVARVGGIADRLPATMRLVARDSARQRTRAATAVAATMVVLVAPVVISIGLATGDERQLIHGLPEDGRTVVVGFYGWDSGPVEYTDADIAAVAEVIPDALRTDLRVYEGGAVLAGVAPADWQPTIDVYAAEAHLGHPASLRIGELTPALVAVLGLDLDLEEPKRSEAVLLGRRHGSADVIVGGGTITATEVPAGIPHWSMPRLLVTAVVAERLALRPDFETVVFVNEVPLTERQRLQLFQLTVPLAVSFAPGIATLTLEMLAMGATLVVVLLIVGLVTALASTESDHDLRTMVAIGARPHIRRRFLGAQTWYYTMFAALLATPLALLLYKVSLQDWGSEVGPFGVMASTAVIVPWRPIAVVVILIPLAIGLVTAATVRSAPATPPRRIG